MPILAPRKIKEVILYGNPVLGPTGEDPLQIRIENLVEAALLPSNFGREHAVDVITDIPRENIPKKGHLVGRQARYRDFTMKEVCSILNSVASSIRSQRLLFTNCSYFL